MADNEQGVIELSDDGEEKESDEEQELSQEHGLKKNLQPLENATPLLLESIQCCYSVRDAFMHSFQCVPFIFADSKKCRFGSST